MTSGHHFFEVLCALAISGELDERALAEFGIHARECDVCRQRLMELAFVGSQLSQAREFKSKRIRAPKGMLERFITRAADEGVPLQLRRRALAPHLAFGALAMAILAVAPAALRWKAPAPASAAPSAMPAAGQQSPTPDRSTSNALHSTVKHQLAIFRAPASFPARRKAAGAKAETRSSIAKLHAPLPASVQAREPYADNPQVMFVSLNPQPHVFTLWTEKPALPTAFLLSDNRSSCDAIAIRRQPWDLNPSAEPGRHIFCYNSGVTSLTSVELFHATASNAARGFYLEELPFHLPERSTQ
jgi:hypothetical protein